ncbi:MAG TPA: S53 family peptidase [Nocardioidaceae bacterium]|nr:S53 family peptidase [Nocardioidaceae bacterium]
MTAHPPDNTDRTDLELCPLPGSERAPAPGVTPTTEALDSSARIEVTLVLRRRAAPSSGSTPPGQRGGPVAPGQPAGPGGPTQPDPAQHPAEPDLTPSPAAMGRILTKAELAASYGADPADVDLVTETMARLGVEVLSTDAASRRVRIGGGLSRLARVFGADLEQVRSTDPTGGESTHRHRTGGLSVPAALDGVVVAVLGLDDRPQARAQFRTAKPEAVTTSYTPLQVGAAYDFPPGTDGTGQTVAIIELGGGFAQSDLDAYFSGLGVTVPSVTAVGVDGAANSPTGDPNGADAEVLLDIEVSGALAPGASYVVYFAPNTDAGFVDAVSEAAQADPTPAAMSISWGQSEDLWTAQARTALDQAIADAAALGVTVTVAAGDRGSTDGETGRAAHVDFPASSPHALACGGTRLETGAGGAVTAETVWNDGTDSTTGGGVSVEFPLPSWQRAVGVPLPAATAAGADPPAAPASPAAGAASAAVQPDGAGGATGGPAAGRGVPDVAGDADPDTGYRVLVDGQQLVAGGTSAVAPLWAALVARLAQALGRPLGLVQPLLYAGVAAGASAPGFRDITSGDNGAYAAGPGWDACSGLGTPDGRELLARLQA